MAQQQPEQSSKDQSSKTYVYKTIGNTNIEIDVLLPDQIKYVNGNQITVLLYIHVGGWMAGSRLEYPKVLVHEALSEGWVFASMDHRLLPESSFIGGQLEDIRDVEGWLRKDILSCIDNKKPDAKIGDIVVAGASSGGHLALLTPKLWTKAPTAIISLYGPTNMHNTKGLTKGPRSKFPLPDFTPEFLRSITHYDDPPTNIQMISAEGFSPRMLLGMQIFRQGTTAEFLLRGLREDDGGNLALPELGIVTPEEKDSISPLSIAKTIDYPPTCQLIGTEDDGFDLSHIRDLAAVFEERGVQHKETFVSGAGHGFDLGAEVGDDIHKDVIRPAVRWASQFVGNGE